MGANRAQRRKAEREQMRNWVRMDRHNQVLSLQRNGITEQDLNQAREDGYRDGYMYAAEGFLKKMYAAVGAELLDAGNTKEEVLTFIKGVDHRFSVMFDADEEINAVSEKLGLFLNIDRNAVLDRVREVKRE